MTTTDRRVPSPFLTQTVLILGAITVLRVIALFITDLNLGPDEAQYWSWSRALSFGYFSKPPMIAWVIALTTNLGGDSEAFVRLASPLLHFATSLVVFFLARDVQDERTAFWSALIYATLPAIWFSSGLITTDVPLLFFWSLALLAFHRVLETRNIRWTLVLGVALGLGFLSKYAMVYFFLGAVVLFITCAHARWFFTSRLALISGGVMALMIAPNIIWNFTHHFPTFSHTAANANWRGELFNLNSLLSFLLSQAGIMGPLLIVTFVWGAWAVCKRTNSTGTTSADVFLLSFSLPILLLVVLQSFISRANANWAAPAYIGATIFVVSWLMKQRIKWVIPVSFSLHIVMGIVLVAMSSNLALIEAAGLSNAFKRVRGWDEIGNEIAAMADKGGYRTILTDDRLVMAELLYYARPRHQYIRIWDYDGKPQNQYEMDAAFHKDAGSPVLLVARASRPNHILNAFDTAEIITVLNTRTGVDKRRVLTLYRLEGFHGT